MSSRLMIALMSADEDLQNQITDLNREVKNNYIELISKNSVLVGRID